MVVQYFLSAYQNCSCIIKLLIVMNQYNIPSGVENIEKNTTSLVNPLDRLFLADVRSGLRSEKKYLDSKYFYDKNGNSLFKQIMHCEEYYPYKSELEILSRYSSEIANAIMVEGCKFDVVELGVGDCSKTIHLLTRLLLTRAEFTYQPIDISEQVITDLNYRLCKMLPDLKFKGFQGDYFQQLERVYSESAKRKVILFLGSSLGNMSAYDAMDFCRKIRIMMSPGDMFIVGIDIKKNPVRILAAYNDKDGITRKFNLNLLTRINRELGGNFDISSFEHFPTYDPQTGTCNSYLVSSKHQVLKLRGERINFSEGECIHMEIAQKYSITELKQIAEISSFNLMASFCDRQKYFRVVIWKAV